MKNLIEPKIRASAFIIIILLLMFTINTAIGQTGLEGRVIDVLMKDKPILFGTVVLYKNDVLIIGTETDLNGDYIFNNLDPGIYTVEASCIGYIHTRVKDVLIKEGDLAQLDLAIKKGVITCYGFVIPYKVPLIDVVNTSTGKTFTSKEIRMMAK